MRHPAMRRTRRNPRPQHDEGASRPAVPTGPSSPAPTGAVPEAPADGDHNQGGARPEGIDYQRDLGSEQDA
ncbi:hypothetical protein WJ59_27215 [Burkholderia gladioli]|uniref:Uncharacterized protein n=1 Tax=Burkholderia gladioli (strain BSR3) TaxID=999541 RepID=F2LFR4_BURGS|nr:hypothetical protein [Burkholderia gladioli]AEA61698.1 hypothetical protein bgla_1g30890 [Burkholderia gladioli BSR3]KVM62258.1 hypothetical protein WJ59_27215 [Burkholderia gladioli]MBA1363678.1 hypothetical protein [Burkholderia gladioli]MBU9179384.1 hypothetical protein [Burkholderia gladioli]MBW5283355.1 hypothetical protein [Burkholderia gladioli]